MRVYYEEFAFGVNLDILETLTFGTCMLASFFTPRGCLFVINTTQPVAADG